MPTYRNDGATTVKILNENGDVVLVKPTQSIRTFESDLPTTMTQTSTSPTRSVTVSGAPPASGTWSDWVHPDSNDDIHVNMWGTWAGTVHLQCKKADGQIVDVVYFTSNRRYSLTDREKSVRYRIGVKNGNYTSGTINASLT